MGETSRYMPRHAEGSLLGRADRLFTTFTYDVWRRELKRFGKTQPDRPLKIVDIGCGPGFLLGCLKGWFPGVELTGVDQNDDLLRVAETRCPEMTPLKGDATALPLPDGYADVAFALHVVEHLSHPDQFFAEARRVLRPGGMLVIATPNAEGLGARIMRKKWQGYDDPTHVSLHGPSYWNELIDNSGFAIARRGTTGLSGIPLFNKMPLGLIHWIPGFFCGYFSWKLGEAYVCVAIRSRGMAVTVGLS